MTPPELEAYDEMMKSRDEWKARCLRAEHEAVPLRASLTAARNALQSIEDRFCDGDDTHDDWLFMGQTACAALKGGADE